MGDYHNHDSTRCSQIQHGKDITYLTGFGMLMLLAIKILFTADLADISLAHMGITLYAVCSLALTAFYIFMIPFGFVGTFFLITKCDHLWILVVGLEIIGIWLLV